MSNDGKHHFHLKAYSILQLLYAGTLPAKVSELNTAVLLQMEMELQVPSAWELKRRNHLRKLSQLDAFSFFRNV